MQLSRSKLPPGLATFLGLAVALAVAFALALLLTAVRESRSTL